METGKGTVLLALCSTQFLANTVKMKKIKGMHKFKTIIESYHFKGMSKCLLD